MKFRKFTRMIAGELCECTEAIRQDKMRLKLEASFGDGYDVADLILIPIDIPDEAITILSDFWLTEKEKELGLPVGCSCTSNSWWAGHANTDCDHLLTGKYQGLILKVIHHMNSGNGYNRVRIYFDKHGDQILAGMTIRHDDGDTEKVYACSVNGIEDLGVDAVNPAYRKNHPLFCDDVYYPLSHFNLSKEWEIISRN